MRSTRDLRILATHEIRTEDRAVTPAIRAAAAAALMAAVAITWAGCAPSTGSLGTPAAPVVTQTPPGEASPSDVAPETPLPSASPTTAPSTDPTGSGAPTTPNPAATPSATPTGTTIVRAYFMLGSFTDNPGLAPVLRTVPETQAVARAAMNALLAGPEGAELEASPAMYTSIPGGTRLLGISITDGVATVNLSGEFKGASASFQAGTATAQVVYTVTQFAAVTLVRIQVDGVASGGALGRSDFQIQGILPAIFVDRPAWGAAAGNPVKLSGLANVFEAQFRVQVLDRAGTLIADKPVTASCGTGCWGTFKADVAYAVDTAQYGTLRVFDLSPRDGAPENVTEYRVWLTPAP
ncbi:MAG: GerMN domain-containing protein [Chloroflexi bacterium]|nr:GerMN domain-containing protein [Chloroflexota bacterium]